MSFKDLILLLFLYSSFQAFILGIIFLFKKQNRNANVLFGVTMFTFSFHLLFNYLNWKGYVATIELINLMPFKPIVWYLYGPLLYLYFKRLLVEESFLFKEIVHIIPLCIFIYFFIPSAMIPAAEKLWRLQHSEVGLFVNLKIVFVYILILFFYLFLIYRLLFVHLNLPDYVKIWARWTYYPFVIYVVCLTLLYVQAYNHIIKINDRYEYLIGFLIISPIWITTYFAYIQPDIFTGKRIFTGFSFGKYRHSGLTKSFSMELRDKLVYLLKEEAIYKQSDLTLDKVAEKLDTSRHNTSQVINEHFDLNFFELVNKHRISKAMELFQQDPNEKQSVLDIAIEVGFNNRVTFNKVFKRETGQTPTAYRRNVKKQDLP